MTKCIGTPADWIAEDVGLDELDFLEDDLRVGESRLNRSWLERTNGLVLDIANDFNCIKSSAIDDLDKWDCSQVQDRLTVRLKRLNSETQTAIKRILSSQFSTLKKHRYFILFSYGTIYQLEHLLRIVGRLSELNQKIYFEDKCKPFMCEESIVIHSLTSVWTAALGMMNSFKEPASQLFKPGDESQDNFIESLEFSTNSLHYSKVFLMDLMVSSWLQFNRLLKFEDLVKSMPLLCSCHTKQYFKTLDEASRNAIDKDLLAQLLPVFLDHQSKFSLTTQSIRQYGIVPVEPCFASSNREELAYFVVWHLYSVSRIATDKHRTMVQECEKVLIKCANLTLKQFLPQAVPDKGYRVSPHQEERFNLLFLMLTSWCEKNGLEQSLSVIILMISFFDQHWEPFNRFYFDNPDFRVEGLTLFQLFTRIINEISPLYTLDGQAAEPQVQVPTREQEELKNIWNRIVERREFPRPV